MAFSEDQMSPNPSESVEVRVIKEEIRIRSGYANPYQQAAVIALQGCLEKIELAQYMDTKKMLDDIFNDKKD